MGYGGEFFEEILSEGSYRRTADIDYHTYRSSSIKVTGTIKLFKLIKAILNGRFAVSHGPFNFYRSKQLIIISKYILIHVDLVNFELCNCNYIFIAEYVQNSSIHYIWPAKCTWRRFSVRSRFDDSRTYFALGAAGRLFSVKYRLKCNSKVWRLNHCVLFSMSCVSIS